MKPLYNVPKVGNYLFATYQIYHKDKLGMKESIYDPYFLFSSGPAFGIVRMQIDETLILANNDFASIEEDGIKSAKIMTKNREYLTPAHLLRFNDAQIRLDLDRTVLIKESHIRGILQIRDNVADSTSSKRIIWKKLLPKE